MKKLTVLFAILISSLSFAQCPEVILELSDSYNLVFEGDIEKDVIVANGIIFHKVKPLDLVKIMAESAKTIFENFSEEPLDLTNFKTTEGDKKCYYPDVEEAMFTYNLNDEFPEGEKYMVFDLSGELIDKGTTNKNTVKFLPRDKTFFLSVGDFDIKEMYLSHKKTK